MTSETIKAYINKITQTASPEDYCSKCMEFIDGFSKSLLSLYKKNDKNGLYTLFTALKDSGAMFDTFSPETYQDWSIQDIFTILSAEIGDTLLWKMKDKFSEKESPLLIPELLSISNEIIKETENLAVWIIPQLYAQYPVLTDTDIIFDSFKIEKMVDEQSSRVLDEYVKKVLEIQEKINSAVLSNPYFKPLFSTESIILESAKCISLEWKYLLGKCLYSTWAAENDYLSEYLKACPVPSFLYPLSSFNKADTAIPDFKGLITKLATINEKVKSTGRGSLKDFIDIDEKKTLEGIFQYEREILQTVFPLVLAGTDPIAVSSIIEGKINAILQLQKLRSDMLVSGLLALQSGDQPEIVKDKIESLSYTMKEECLDSIIEEITEFSSKARKNGIHALKEDATKTTDSMMRTGLQMVMDGVHPEDIRCILNEIVNRRLEEMELYFSVLQYGIKLIQLGTDTEVLKSVLAGMIPFFQNNIKEKSKACDIEHVKAIFKGLGNSHDKPQTLLFEYIASLMRLEYRTTNYVILVKSFLQLSGKESEEGIFLNPVQDIFKSLKHSVKKVFQSKPSFDPAEVKLQYISDLLNTVITVQGWNKRLSNEIWKLKNSISSVVKKLT
ncbi:MAG: hypothetical protein JSV25_04720 [Spirochaetota bacterium]|nr:MAG: hypothetical protein JSV25_04720 [Spirochaetota bacterium]